MQLSRFVGPAEVKNFLANYSIIIEHLIEFSEFKKDDFIEHCCFYVPKLFHSLSELDVFERRNVDCSWVILGVCSFSFLGIHYLVWLKEAGKEICWVTVVFTF